MYYCHDPKMTLWQLNHLVIQTLIYLYSVNIYATPHYSKLNIAQFCTLERRTLRVHWKWQEWKWHKIEVINCLHDCQNNTDHTDIMSDCFGKVLKSVT